jgi:hypothetical protein
MSKLQFQGMTAKNDKILRELEASMLRPRRSRGSRQSKISMMRPRIPERTKITIPMIRDSLMSQAGRGE